MIPAYIVNAFPERREHLQEELRTIGGIEEIRWVEAPVGMAAVGEGFTASSRWRDPYENFKLLLAGELACAAGHHEAWRRIAESEEPGAVILEDDAHILGSLKEVPHRGDLTYLGGRFMAKAPDQEDGFIRAPYTYWLVAYWISKAGASKLVQAFRKDEVIPSDEFVPYHSGQNPHVNGALHRQNPPAGLDAWALPEWIVEPSGKFGSGSRESDPCFTLETAVFGTDPARAGEAFDAYKRLGYRPKLLGAGRPGWDTSKRGCTQKLEWLRDWLARKDLTHSIILASDGYDTLPIVNAHDLLKRFGETNADIVISGERTCWPDEELKEPLDAHFKNNPFPATPYRYPCAGLYMGFAKEVAELLADPIVADDEQLFMQQRMLTAKDCRWQVDGEGYLFQSLHGADQDMHRKWGWPINKTTNCYPAILHANGPSNMDIARPTLMGEPHLANDAFSWIDVGDGILGMPFLEEDSAARIAAAGRRVPLLWQALEGDKVPGDELRVRALDSALAGWITTTLKERLAPIIDARWRPARWHDPSDTFLIRYSANRQNGIRLHEDISHFSCSIRLASARCGGELVFPRQNFSDRTVPTGWLLVWPSRITHPHMVTPVTAGERLSWTVWTSASESEQNRS